MTDPLLELATLSKAAARRLAQTSETQRNAALEAIASGLLAEKAAVLAANALDVQRARAAGLDEALIDRLLLDAARLDNVIQDVRSVIALPDPLADQQQICVRADGLRLCRQSVPLGVLAVIYESRPNVTIDCAALALKSGNAAILRGGKETQASNRALVAIVQAALSAVGLPAAAIATPAGVARTDIGALLQLSEFIDLAIPRGGAALHKYCREVSKVPLIAGGVGICHLYVDASAQISGSLAVIENAKVQRPSACNALDTLLIHQDLAAELLPQLLARLAPQGVRLRGCAQICSLVSHAALSLASEDDFATEWLSLVLSLKIVADLDAALAHIAEHGTGHSEGILTEHPKHAARFLREVDAAAVYHNASTRFTDGSQLGLGAEIAVSTGRLHARGPMGLRELTTYKWLGQGEYHVR